MSILTKIARCHEKMKFNFVSPTVSLRPRFLTSLLHTYPLFVDFRAWVQFALSSSIFFRRLISLNRQLSLSNLGLDGLNKRWSESGLLFKCHFARLWRNKKATNGRVVVTAINIMKPYGNNIVRSHRSKSIQSISFNKFLIVAGQDIKPVS